MGLCDHTGPRLAPGKVHSHILHEVPKNNQKTVGCGGPFAEGERDKPLFLFSTHME